MTDTPDVTVVRIAKSVFDAQVMAGVLRAAGIPVYVGGASLNDEFAVSQRLVNLSQVELQVPTDRVDDAKRALAEADRSRELLERDDFDPGEPVE